MKRDEQSGQSLVEFALIVPIFVAVMAGLLDGCRLVLTYNDLQEAARAGARWGAVEVNRDHTSGYWGTFSDPGNNPNLTYSDATSNLTVNTTGNGTQSTIVGEVAKKLIAVDRSKVGVVISTSCGQSTYEDGTSSALSGCPVTVKVSYTFKPVLGFGNMRIKMTGVSTSNHE